MIEVLLDKLLEEQGRTFYWLSKETGISHTTLWRLKKGKALGINFETLMKLEELAGRSGHTMLDLAIGWLASLPYVGSVIAGATKPEQVEQNAKAGDWRLTPEEMKEVDEILGVGQQGRGQPGRGR